MNKEMIKGHWNEIKGKMKQQWAKFTDNEVAEMEGNYDELMGKLQQKYGYQKDQAEREINDFMRKNHWDH